MGGVQTRTISGPNTASSILALFIAETQRFQRNDIIGKLSYQEPMNQTEKYLKDLGPVPSLREFKGTHFTENFTEKEVLLKTIKYSTGVEYDEDLSQDELWERIQRRIPQIAERVSKHARILLSGKIEENPTCFDGKALYANDHPIKDGVNDNLLTGSGTTVANFETDYWNALEVIRSMKDLQGELLLREQPSLLVHVPLGLQEAAEKLQQSIVIQNNTNIVRMRYDLWVDAVLANATDWYIHVVGETTKLFAYGLYTPARTKTWTENNKDLVKVIGKIRHNFAPNDYTLSVKIDNA